MVLLCLSAAAGSVADTQTAEQQPVHWRVSDGAGPA
jgi:hypothetical protein